MPRLTSRPREIRGVAPRRVAVASLVALVALAPPAAADEKQVCAQRYREAQELRLQSRLRAARADLVACAQPVCPRFIQVECAQWLAEVDRSLPTVVVELRDARGADVAVASLRVDEEDVPPPGATAIAVDPGEHVFHARGVDGAEIERRVTVRQGDMNLRITLTETEPAHDVRATRRAIPTGAYVLGAVGVAALGSFGYFFVSGYSRQRQLKSDCAPACSSSDVAPVRERYLAADVSLGVMVLASASALWIALARPTDRGVKVGAGVAPGSFAASLIVPF